MRDINPTNSTPQKATSKKPVRSKAKAVSPPSGVTAVPIQKPATPSSRYASLHFGPPLLPGEKKRDYFEMLQWVADAIQPQDILEILLCKEIADASLDVERLKHLFNASIRERWFDLIQKAVETKDFEVEGTRAPIKAKIFTDSIRGKDDDEICVELIRRGIDGKELLAEAYRRSFKDAEQFNALSIVGEKRRRRAIKDIENYRLRKSRPQRRLLPSPVHHMDAAEIDAMCERQ